MKLIVTLILLFSTMQSYALGSWYSRHSEGWFWYKDPAKKEKKQQKPRPPNPELAQDPLEWAETVRKKGEWLQAQALKDNNEKNVEEYIKHQTEQVERANSFSTTWDHVLRKNPQYDYSIANPTMQLARNIYYDEQNKKTDDVLQEFGQKYGFLFFFDSKCPYSAAQAPLVQQVAKKHNIELLSVSLDGGKLPDLEHIEIDNGISSKLNVFSSPSVFAVNFQSDDAFPIAVGSISINDLEARILGVAEYEQLL